MEDVVQEATFSPAVRKYILWVPALVMCLTIVGIPIAILWLILPGRIVARRYYEALECTLTQSKLKFKKGVLVNVEKTIPLENIQDLTFLEGPILRAFKLSILKIETAGNSGSGRADMQLIGVEGAQEFRNRVLGQRDMVKSGHNQQAPSTDVLLKEIRDIAKEIRDHLKS